MFLSHQDLRIAAGPLIPEVLPPDTSPGARHTEKFANTARALMNGLKEMQKTVEYYTPRVTNRNEMYNVIRSIQRAYDEVEEYIQALRKIEETWEEEEFQEGERQQAWRPRKF